MSVSLLSPAAWMKERCSVGDTKTPSRFGFLIHECVIFSVSHYIVALRSKCLIFVVVVVQVVRIFGPRQIRPVLVSPFICGSSSENSCLNLTTMDAASAGSTKKKVSSNSSHLSSDSFQTSKSALKLSLAGFNCFFFFFLNQVTII